MYIILEDVYYIGGCMYIILEGVYTYIILTFNLSTKCTRFSLSKIFLFGGSGKYSRIVIFFIYGLN